MTNKQISVENKKTSEYGEEKHSNDVQSSIAEKEEANVIQEAKEEEEEEEDLQPESFFEKHPNNEIEEFDYDNLSCW